MFSNKFAIADSQLIMVLYVNFIYKAESLWLRVSRFDGDVVVGRVWNHPVHRGLLFGQLIGIPIGDVIDNMCSDEDL